MQKHLFSTLLLLSLGGFGIMLSAMGDSYRFMHITGNEGLPHQQVEALMQDDRGQLWIGTRNGLSRYDGYSVSSYFNQADNPNSLHHNFIKKIIQDSKKRIWIGTHCGVCLYRPASDDFRNYDMPAGMMVSSIVETATGTIVCGGTRLYIYNEDADEFVEQQRHDGEFIVSMAVGVGNRLFISTNRSVYYYDESFSTTTQINPLYFADFITGSDGIIPLFFDSRGTLWMGRNGKGVTNIDFTTDEVVKYDALRLSDGTVRAIAEDRDGRIWLGTEKGITILNRNGVIEIMQQDFVDKNKLNDNAIYAIVCDRDDNMWIGTYFGGINVLLKNSEQFRWTEAGYGALNVKGKAVRRMVELQNNILWIATEDGGLNICNTVTGNIDVFNRIPNLGHNVHEIFYDTPSKEMWIGTFRNGLFRYSLQTGASEQYLPTSQNGLPSDAIFAIAKQKNGVMWVGTTQGLRYYSAKANSFVALRHSILDSDFIYCLLIDCDDNVWVGTRNNGLFRINSTTREVSGWTAKANNSGLNDNYITSLYQDARNRIWIGTNNGGLQYIDPADAAIRALTDGMSLSRSTICSIIEDELGRLWIGTSDGLYQFNSERCAFVCYTVEDGLPINQFNFSSAIQAQNGQLYFGSVNGLISFAPKTIKEDRGPFHVYLTHLSINNQVITSRDPDSPLDKAIDDTEHITFTYRQSRSFSIKYAAISLGNTSTINYQIRLPEMSEEWQSTGLERHFTGSNLPAGRYHLQIRANNSNEGWDNAPVKEISFTIRPPYHLSIVAFFIYTAIVALLLFVIYKIFSIRLRERNAIRMANLEKEKMEEINKVKMDFFTSVSHELKTPLSLISAPLKYIAQHENISPESTDKLDTAIKNTGKMVGLIDELVTFNRIESGNFQFYVQKGNPLEFIANIAQLFGESAAEKSITLSIRCENNGEEVWFSPSYIEKITNNLLSNAIKFTLAGGEVSVSAAITDNDDGFTYLRIEVRDTGIGILEEEFGNIFEKYYQTKRGHNVNYKGWGIGLALVHKLSEIHKGNITLQSKAGEGSCFTVHLNVSESAFDTKNEITPDKNLLPLSRYEFTTPLSCGKPADAVLPQESGDAELSEFTILLVEDNAELLNFLSVLFSSKYTIYTAKNGVRALDIAMKHPVDLVISDVMMPEMDGNELCHTLKNDISTSHIPVILLTALNETDSVMKGFQSGAEAYIQKPFDPQILEFQVKNIIQVKQALRDKIINAKGSKVESVFLSKYDTEFINKVNKIIDDNIENEDLSIPFITERVGVSRSVLHVKIKSLLNITIGDYIRKKRLTKARELLLEGCQVGDTAWKTGFTDPSYFTKCFKREFGIKPTELQGK
ncbi:MAG: response regulator [Cytophagaceae bacterium]|jgi:ligand-binding sensor domain-containing protein/signal transduction histidine kinase/DNA-binding response OmpR family regulator|nr:response regulator [Cytophagaceae bacterium]